MIWCPSGDQYASAFSPSPKVIWRTSARWRSRGSSVTGLPARTDQGIHSGLAVVTALGIAPSGSGFLGAGVEQAGDRNEGQGDEGAGHPATLVRSAAQFTVGAIRVPPAAR